MFHYEPNVRSALASSSLLHSAALPWLNSSMLRLTTLPVLALLCVGAGSAAPQSKEPTFIIDQQVGQATGHTCQSYVLAIALAFKLDPGIPLKSWRDIRDLEGRLRAEVVKARDARQPTVPVDKRLVSPADSAQAVEVVSGGTYTVTYKTYDETQFVQAVGARTGVSTAIGLRPSFLIGGLVKDVLISSARKIGDKPYNSGHQFAILGVSGPQNSSSALRQYLVLNSAAYRKPGEQAFNTCQDRMPDDPGPYFPSLSWRNDIEWNLDNGRMRAMTVDRK